MVVLHGLPVLLAGVLLRLVCGVVVCGKWLSVVVAMVVLVVELVAILAAKLANSVLLVATAVAKLVSGVLRRVWWKILAASMNG